MWIDPAEPGCWERGLNTCLFCLRDRGLSGKMQDKAPRVAKHQARLDSDSSSTSVYRVSPGLKEGVPSEKSETSYRVLPQTQLATMLQGNTILRAHCHICSLLSLKVPVYCMTVDVTTGRSLSTCWLSNPTSGRPEERTNDRP